MTNIGTTAPTALKGDRIVDFLKETIDVAPDGSLIFEGHLGPDHLKVSLYDRPAEARGTTGRRFLIRLQDAHGEENRTRVFQHEPSAVEFLTGLSEGRDMRLPARGVASRPPKSSPAKGPRIRRLGSPANGHSERAPRAPKPKHLQPTARG